MIQLFFDGGPFMWPILVLFIVGIASVWFVERSFNLELVL